MWLMSCTLDTAHFEMSLLKVEAPMKMALISVTVDTSHASIGPAGLLGATLRNELTACVSSDLDFGEK